MTPLVMTLRRILRLHCVTGFVEFGFFQVEASWCVERAVCFNIVKKQGDFMVGPASTGTSLLRTDGRSVANSGRANVVSLSGSRSHL